MNRVLASECQLEESNAQVERLGLPRHPDPAKHWDALAALDHILATTGPEARVFDAGGELYSTILPWLFLYGYSDLTAGNLAFGRPQRRGRIRYEHADITSTTYPARRFDVITCLSVIEHGVDIDAYFREMARILADGGLLITSTDYFDTPVDTRGRRAYGVPIHVFTAREIASALQVADRHGFELESPLDLSCVEAPIRWDPHGLSYTFIVFALRKRTDVTRVTPVRLCGGGGLLGG